MRFDTNQHQFYWGIALHARSMYVCMVSGDGDILLHRNMKAAPEPCLQAVAPYRDGLVVAVECLFPWSWLADRCAAQGMPFVLGHALSLTAMPGGQATHDQIDSQKLAAWLRGGMLPQAYVYPAEMRAPPRSAQASHPPEAHTRRTLGSCAQYQQPVPFARDRHKARLPSPP